MGPTSQDTPVPVNDPGISGQNNASANPVLDALSAAVQHAQVQVQAANKQVSNTPMYSQHSGTQPVMPVPKPTLFGGSSERNVQNQVPQTRAGARNKAIGQLAGMAGNAVGTYMKKKEAEKTQNLAQDIHRSLELTQGIDEANSILQQDPNNSSAKAQLQKNQALLKALLDGKNGKEIAKAYDITFGPSAQEEKEKNAKTPQKQAMTQALKQVQQDRLTEFQSKMPSTMGPNPAYEAAQKQAQEVQKQANELTKTYMEMAKGVYETQGRQNVADTNAKARTDAATITADKGRDVEVMKEDAAVKLEVQKHQARMQEIGAQGANRIRAIKEAKTMDNSKGQKMAEDFAKSLQGNITSNQREIDKLEQELNKPENKVSENSAARKTIQDQINNLKTENTKLDEQRNQAILEMHGDPAAAAMFQLIGKDDDQ